MRVVSIPMLHCYRCAYSWYPRTDRVRTCPRCKSIRWDIPMVNTHSGPRTGLGVEEVIGQRRAKLMRLLCKYGAQEVRVFGSVARGMANPKSDVDLLVRFDRPIGLLRRVELIEKVERLLGREVDLTTENGLHWLVRPQALAEAVPL